MTGRRRGRNGFPVTQCGCPFRLVWVPPDGATGGPGSAADLVDRALRDAYVLGRTEGSLTLVRDCRCRASASEGGSGRPAQRGSGPPSRAHVSRSSPSATASNRARRSKRTPPT